MPIKARRRREIGRRWWSLNVTVGVSGENRRQTEGERQKTLDEGTLLTELWSGMGRAPEGP